MLEDSSLLRYAVKIGTYLAIVKTREMQAPEKAVTFYQLTRFNGPEY